MPKLIPMSLPFLFFPSSEQTLGGLDAFKPYIQSYVSTFAGQSISTEMWKDHLYSFWKKHGGEEAIKKLDSVKWDEWLHGEGTKLPVEMKYDTSLADSVSPSPSP
jgi:leukotriene-A4 hydrolase